MLIALLLTAVARPFWERYPPRPLRPGKSGWNSAFASALNSDATTGMYIADGGNSVMLTLGPPYVSARGLTCRIGRRNGDRYAYGFCRDGANWYAVPPALVSGN